MPLINPLTNSTPVVRANVAPAAKEKHNDLGHKIGHLFKELGEDAFDTVAKGVGVIELLGVRYPVTHYSEKVSAGLTRASL